MELKFKVSQIAALLGAEVVGNADAVISGLAKIEEGSEGTLTFFANPKYESFVYTTRASAILVPKDFQPEKAVHPAMLKVTDPYSAFSLLLEKAQQAMGNKQGVESGAHIAPSARVGKDVYIGAFAYVGNNAVIGDRAKIYPFTYIGDHAIVGEGSVLHANVSLYMACQVGKNCIVHAGTVIGSDGFGFAPQKDGSYKKVPQTGIVVLEDGVEIGANCTIDRATLGKTVIKKGSKIDNLVQIAHNVEVGESTVIAAQSGVSGSSKLGKHCMVGGQVGIVGHVELADGTKIGAQSGVSKSFSTPGQALRGSPAQPLRKQLKSEVLFRQLEDMSKKIAELEKKISNFES